jgi:hypothetical protein
MNKILTMSLIAASAIYAGTWSLKGAISDINATDVQTSTDCIKTVWTYDDNGSWNLYQSYDASQNNYGINQLTTITAGRGYWVNGDCTEDNTTNNEDNTNSLDKILITTTTTTATISDLQTAGTFFDIDGYGDWFGKFVISNSTDISLIDYDYNGTTWEAEDEQNGTMSNISGSSTRVTFNGGGVYDIDILKTGILSDINSTEIDSSTETAILAMNINISDVNITVVTPGPVETDVWDGNTSATNLSELETLFTQEENPYWIGGDESPMMLKIGGDIVKANCRYEEIYKTCERTDIIISDANWTNDGSKLIINAPTEVVKLSVINENETNKIQAEYQDVQGAVFQEKFITGTNLDETAIKLFLESL